MINRDDVVFEKDPMNKLVKNKELMQYDHDGFCSQWIHEEYKMLNEMYDENKAEWKIW